MDDSKIFHTKLTMVEDMCTHVVSLRDYVCFDQQISDATPTFCYCDMNVPNQGRDQPLIVCLKIWDFNAIFSQLSQF